MLFVMIVTSGLVDCPAWILKSVETLPVKLIGPATADRAPKSATTTKQQRNTFRPTISRLLPL